MKDLQGWDVEKSSGFSGEHLPKGRLPGFGVGGVRGFQVKKSNCEFSSRFRAVNKNKASLGSYASNFISCRISMPPVISCRNLSLQRSPGVRAAHKAS